MQAPVPSLQAQPPLPSLMKWDQLYEENKNKLNMPRNQNYPLDRASLHNFADVQPTASEIRVFAQLLLDKLIYVPWQEFVSSLRALVQEVIGKYPPHTTDYVIILTGTEYEMIAQLEKSQVWVALLAYGMFKQMNIPIAGIVTTPTDAYIWIETHGRPATFLVFDDGSYSGSQLAAGLKWTRPDGENALGADENIPLFGFKTPRTVLMVPYASEWARYRIAQAIATLNHNWVMVGSTALYRVSAGPVEWLTSTKQIPETVFRGKRVWMLYFDHKMADEASVGIVGIVSPLVPFLGGLTCIPFIGGCEQTQCQNVALLDPKTFTPSRKKRDAITQCPPAFYKSIQWTLNGVRLFAGKSMYEILTGIKYPYEKPKAAEEESESSSASGSEQEEESSSSSSSSAE